MKAPAMLAFLAAALTLSPGQGQQPTTALAQPGAYQTDGVYFGRAGQAVTVELGPIMGAGMDQAVLVAFGRTWTEPSASRKQGVKWVVDFKTPAVRVPTVFRVSPPGKPNLIMGEVVAYPDNGPSAPAGARKLALYSCGVPGWFDQWAAATGLPVTRVGLADLAAVKAGVEEKTAGALLIIGRGGAGAKDLADVVKVAADKEINILVLDAEWFGEAAGPLESVEVAAKQLGEGLAEVGKQHWPQPLKFSTRRPPWPGVANRWAWIAGANGLPLVEEIRPFTANELTMLPAGTPQADTALDQRPQMDPVHNIVVSYLPWREQLGRNESADATLLALLAGVAKSGPRGYNWHPIRQFLPPRENAGPPVCPVLAAVRSGKCWEEPPHPKPGYHGPFYFILDLRGQEPLSPIVSRGRVGELSLSKYCYQEIHSAAVVTLLILGDDKALDDWEWLKLDRAKKRIDTVHVQWLPDDELPPSKEQRVRLMLKLTELGVALSPPPDSQQKGK